MSATPLIPSLPPLSLEARVGPQRSGYARTAHLAVIIPMYREAGRIEPTLQDVISTLSRGELISEVILVDDGSTDDTREVVSSWLSRLPCGPLLRVRLVRHDHNQGKGAAVRTGLGATHASWRLVMDADNATRVSQLDHFWAAAERGASLITGSRLAPGATVRSGRYRSILRGVFSRVIGSLALTNVVDTQCGFKLYRADLAEHIVEHGREDRFAFDLEHLVLADRFSGPSSVVEIPVEWDDRPGSTVRPVRDGLHMFARALAIRSRFRKQNHPTRS